jgi:hypothetical protein
MKKIMKSNFFLFLFLFLKLNFIKFRFGKKGERVLGLAM